MLTPLRFLDELDPKHVKKIDLAKEEQVAAPKSLDKLKEQKIDEHIEHAKREILEKGLSVTALNCFVSCPSEFLYKSILKLPEPPTASTEKGKAMHEAMATIWKDHKKENIEKIIIDTVRNYMKSSLLPVYEKEAVLEELTKNAPIVAKELGAHFSQEGNMSVEKWFETEFKSKYGKEPVAFNLCGRIDAVVARENELAVYEYKTRESMSLAAIKGEVKSAEHMGSNYFRQIVFYEMLLRGASRLSDKSVSGSIVFLKPNKSGKVPVTAVPVTGQDITNLKSEIDDLVESVWSGRFLTDRCADPSCPYCDWKNLLF